MYSPPKTSEDAKQKLSPVQMATTQMVRLMYHEDGAVALKACTYVMDRCFGKPRETIDVNQKGAGHVLVAIDASMAHVTAKLAREVAE